MSKPLIIDRFEGKFAIIETDDGLFEIPRALLPKETQEGDQLEITVCKKDATEAQERQKRLEERDTGDDIIDL